MCFKSNNKITVLSVLKTVCVVLPLTRTGLATANKKFLAETAS